MTKPAVLLVSRLPEPLAGRLRECFDCHALADVDAAGLQALAPQLRGMVATGESLVNRALMASLPALEVISVLGAGYDGIVMGAARERGICVTHTPGLSTDDIADFAMAQLLAAARQVVNADQFVRRGDWSTGRFPMTRRVSGARLGIVGLGRIGRAVAQRALAFGMEIAYTGRTAKADAPYRWCSDAQTLAASVDFLVVCASGGADTRALVNADVLAALGPSGVLVNIARGSIVDEDALIAGANPGGVSVLRGHWSSRSAIHGHAVCFHPPPQRRPANPQNGAGLALVTADGRQHFAQALLLGLVAGVPQSQGRLRRGAFGKQLLQSHRIEHALRVAQRSMAGQHPLGPVF